MDRGLVEFLTAGAGAEEIAELVARDVREEEALAALTDLRRRHAPDRAAAIFDQALLRRRAEAKFARPHRMLFDRDGLEQATHHRVSEHRARRIAGAAPDCIVDLTCGLGGDSIALSSVAPTIGVDVDRGRVLCARHNVAVAGGPHRFAPVVGDAATLELRAVDVAFADPSRRADGRRIRGLGAYRPSVPDLVERWRRVARSLVVKVAPGIADDEIPDDASVEWVSYDGDLREAVLWFGELRADSRRSATILPAGVTITGPEPEVQVTEVGRFLYEPDDAVIRARLVRVVADAAGLTMIDPNIAYLTGDTETSHPALVGRRVDEAMPFNLKQLRRRLAELDVGHVTIKKRGSPLTPEELRPRLRLQGSAHATLFLTRVGSQPVVLISLG